MDIEQDGNQPKKGNSDTPDLSEASLRDESKGSEQKESETLLDLERELQRRRHNRDQPVNLVPSGNLIDLLAVHDPEEASKSKQVVRELINFAPGLPGVVKLREAQVKFREAEREGNEIARQEARYEGGYALAEITFDAATMGVGALGKRAVTASRLALTALGVKSIAQLPIIRDLRETAKRAGFNPLKSSVRKLIRTDAGREMIDAILSGDEPPSKQQQASEK